MTTGYIGKDRADECCAPFGQEELCALLAELRAMRDRIDQMVITVQHVTVDGTGNVQLPFQEEIGDPDFGNAGSFAGAKSVKAVKVIADAAKITADAAMEANTDALLTLEQSADRDAVTVKGKNITGEVKTTVELPAVDAAHAGVMTPAKMDEIAEEMDRHALDNAVVHKAGDTMTGNLGISSDSPSVTITNDAVPIDLAAFHTVNTIRLMCSNGQIGELKTLRNTPKGQPASILNTSVKNSTGASAVMSIEIRDNGDAKVTIPPTPSEATGNEAATAGWVRSLLQSAGIQVTSLQMKQVYAPVRAEGIRMMNADPEQADAPQIGDGLALDAAPQVHGPVLSQPDPEPPYGFDN